MRAFFRAHIIGEPETSEADRLLTPCLEVSHPTPMNDVQAARLLSPVYVKVITGHQGSVNAMLK